MLEQVEELARAVGSGPTEGGERGGRPSLTQGTHWDRCISIISYHSLWDTLGNHLQIIDDSSTCSVNECGI